MIVDFHTHVWPDQLAAKAIGASEATVPKGDGKVDSLIALMEANNIDKAVCLGIAAIARHVEPTNRFAGTLPEPLIGFGTVHMGLSVEENLESLRRNKLSGIKLNPPFQDFCLDDPKLLELLDAVRGEFVVLAHVGEGGIHGTASMCTPLHIREICHQLPGLDIIAAHLGGFNRMSEVESILLGLPVYLDTSWPPGLRVLEPKKVRSLIERHGAEKVVFASDWPSAEPGREIDYMTNLGLSEGDLDLVLGGNAQRLLKLTA